MKNRTPMSSRRRYAIGTVLVLVVASLAFAGTVIAGDTAATKPDLSTADVSAICSVVSQWNQGDSVPWPASAAAVDLSEDASSQMKSDYRALVDRVGTSEFVSAEGSFDVAGYAEYQREESPDSVCLGHEAEALSVEPVTQEKNGDLIAKVMVWQGWNTAEVDPKTGAIIKEYHIDQTPVHIYTLRNTASGWRIVKETRYYQESSDADVTQYGPDTPHKVLPPNGEVTQE
jgi:hypothetical protein